MNVGSIGSKMRLWFVAPIERHGHGERPAYQRLTVPYSFKPELSFTEAIIGALGAFLRIFLGSILFGVYGWNAIVTWNGIRSPFWRGAAVVPMVLLFLLLFALLMAAISAMVRKLLPRA